MQHEARRYLVASDAAVSVKIVPQDGQPIFREMYPDLMCPAGFRSRLDPDSTRIFRDHAKRCFGQISIRLHGAEFYTFRSRRDLAEIIFDGPFFLRLAL